MPNLDNHMDELFQKAAENYPLKTNTGNFDELMPFIAGEAATTANPGILSGRPKTALLLFAFFIAAISIATYIIANIQNNKMANNKTVLQQKTNTAAPYIASAQVNINNNEAVVLESATENNAATTELLFQYNPRRYKTTGKMLTSIKQSEAISDDNTTTENENTLTEKIKYNKTAADTENQQNDKISNQDTAAKKEIIDKPVKKNGTEQETKPSPKKTKNKPGFYYGIAAGVELNKVKSQDMTKTGFNAGVILGLQINKKIAVETGLQLSQKKYYSDGKYFKPKSGSMPANMTVTSLQSTSTIIEIPVSVKYNFSKKKNTLYGKAGISSYIMTKESNKYNAVVSGQQQEVNSTYKANKGYLASDVRISAGYQRSVNKKLNIRIEPYIQIPLKSIGVGNLPVSTIGVQFVLTRN